MAKQLDTKSKGLELKRQAARTTARNFKIAKIACVAIMAVAAIGTTAKCRSYNNHVVEMTDKYNDLSREFDNIKAKATNTSQTDDTGNMQDGNSESGDSNIIEKQMYSAQEAGYRVCAYQELLFKGELLLESDIADWKRISSDTSLWFGEKLNPAKSGIVWEFLTFYDHIERNYDVMWACYTLDYQYLLCAVFGNYSGENDNFTITGKYTTSYGRTYLVKGAITGVDDSSAGLMDDVADMVGDLTGEFDNGNTNRDNDDTDMFNDIFTIPDFSDTSVSTSTVTSVTEPVTESQAPAPVVTVVTTTEKPEETTVTTPKKEKETETTTTAPDEDEDVPQEPFWYINEDGEEVIYEDSESYWEDMMRRKQEQEEEEEEILPDEFADITYDD